MRDLPVPAIHINFPLVDLTPDNGPIRQIPGTHRSRAPIPRLADEPEWMRFSTICPLPAGSAIIRDARCWHGGTPNLSREVRAMPNVEYFAPWFRSEAVHTVDVVRDVADPHAARAADRSVRRRLPRRAGRRRGVPPPPYGRPRTASRRGVGRDGRGRSDSVPSPPLTRRATRSPGRPVGEWRHGHRRVAARDVRPDPTAGPRCGQRTRRGRVHGTAHGPAPTRSDGPCGISRGSGINTSRRSWRTARSGSTMTGRAGSGAHGPRLSPSAAGRSRRIRSARVPRGVPARLQPRRHVARPVQRGG